MNTTYFGPVQWYRQLCRCTGSVVEIEACESYQKQTTRNRCAIVTANGPQKLTVPVTHGDSRLMRDIQISDHGNWRHLHWQALQTAYGESAFFEYYQDDIRPFFEPRWKYLLDFNTEITHKILELLDVDVELRYTSQYSPDNHIATADEPQKPYYQVYRQRHGFIPDMSILDLLFNEGPEAIKYLLP